MLQAIADLKDHPVVVEVAGLDPDDDRLAALGYAIFNRILDDRLHQQRRKARLLQLSRNVDLDAKAIREARLFDVQIKPLQVDFLRERDVRPWVQREAGSEECGKREQHGLGAVGASGHDQRGQRIESVEQEVRINLIAERPYLGGLGCAFRVRETALRSQRFLLGLV